MRRNNITRAKWARIALDVFATHTGIRDEDLATQASDFLADLMHWADLKGVNFSECVRRAENHYRAEVAGIDDPVFPAADYNAEDMARAIWAEPLAKSEGR